MRARWARGDLARTGRPPHPRDWTPIHDRRLRELAGTVPCAAMAAQVSAEFGVPRTAKAIRLRLWRLGEPVQVRALTQQQVARTLRVAPETVTRWLSAGTLRGTRLGPAPTAAWCIAEEAFEAFLRAQVGTYDWHRIRVRRWRNLAEVLAARAPWLPIPAAAARCGVSPVTLRRWARTGRVAARWQYGVRRGGQWVVDIYAVLARAGQQSAGGREEVA